MSDAPASRSICRCLLIEDQPQARARMRALIADAFPGVRIEDAGSLREAFARLDEPRPLDLAVVDLGLPDGSGIDILRRLARERPEVLPVVATIYDDDAHLFDAIAAGARGYVLKSEPEAVVADCLRRIARGEPPLSPSIAHRILAQLRGGPAQVPDEARLSGRETEVLTLLARGLTAAEIAGAMTLTRNTVAGYIKVIYQKLDVSTRAAATLAAVRRGLA